MSDVESLSFFQRFGLAWVCFYRVLFDGAFAMRVVTVRASAALPPAPAPPEPTTGEAEDAAPALQLLAALQREGRLVDFVEQDIAAFSDSEVGAVARVVHGGCRRALRQHVSLAAVRPEDEEAR